MVIAAETDKTARLLFCILAEKKNEVNTIDVNSSARYLVSGGKDAVLRVYDLNTAKVKKNYLFFLYNITIIDNTRENK